MSYFITVKRYIDKEDEISISMPNFKGEIIACHLGHSDPKAPEARKAVREWFQSKLHDPDYYYPGRNRKEIEDLFDWMFILEVTDKKTMARFEKWWLRQP